MLIPCTSKGFGRIKLVHLDKVTQSLATVCIGHAASERVMKYFVRISMIKSTFTMGDLTRVELHYNYTIELPLLREECSGAHLQKPHKVNWLSTLKQLQIKV